MSCLDLAQHVDSLHKLTEFITKIFMIFLCSKGKQRKGWLLAYLIPWDINIKASAFPFTNDCVCSICRVREEGTVIIPV